ncbi:MAG: ribonuclease Z [Candidatus Bathyarchaeota archaeon]|nr:ribonuclease Z [Candidatus Bathyarchaeota archaeon]
MSLEVVFLGTAGSIPTPTRSLPAVAIVRLGELIIFDCGEGVQRQMVKAGLGFNKKTKIFITHMHGDHMLGLPGLIQTMSLLHRDKKLEVYGPCGTKDFLAAIEKALRSRPTFPLEIMEIKQKGLVCEEEDYGIYATQAKHVAPSFSYSLVEKHRPGKFYPEKARALGIPEGILWSRLQQGLIVKLQDGSVVKPAMVVGPPRPGRKIVYTGDTMFSNALVEFARDADLLIHDCTFDDDLSERAIEDGHSTPSQAAKTAAKSNVNRLILTHVSARYKTTRKLLGQARKTIADVEVAEDFLKIQVPLKDSK